MIYKLVIKYSKLDRYIHIFHPLYFERLLSKVPIRRIWKDIVILNAQNEIDITYTTTKTANCVLMMWVELLFTNVTYTFTKITVARNEGSRS